MGQAAYPLRLRLCMMTFASTTLDPLDLDVGLYVAELNESSW